MYSYSVIFLSRLIAKLELPKIDAWDLVECGIQIKLLFKTKQNVPNSHFLHSCIVLERSGASACELLNTCSSCWIMMIFIMIQSGQLAHILIKACCGSMSTWASIHVLQGGVGGDGGVN